MFVCPIVTAHSFLGGAVGAIKEGKSVLANSLPQLYNHETVFVLIARFGHTDGNSLLYIEIVIFNENELLTHVTIFGRGVCTPR